MDTGKPDILNGHFSFMVHPNVLSFEKVFGLVFMDKDLLLAALDHTNLENKKRYAVAGDKLLDFILYDYLMDRDFSQGEMDTIRQKLTTDGKLAEIGREIGLGDFILFSDSSTEMDKEKGNAYYNDTMEALVYVIMKEYGLLKVTNFVKKYLLSKIQENK